MINMKKMITDLSLANGTSGAEDEIKEKIKSYIPENMTVKTDRFGNIIAVLKGTGKTYLLDAHMDRIGLIVTGIEDGGFLRVAKVGGMDARVLAAQDVTIWGKEPVYGVITSTPPHLSTGDEAKKAVGFDKMLVDTGLSKEKAVELISLGDRITVRCPVTELLNGRIAGAALDDRAGCAAIIRAAELVSEADNHPTVILLFASQEETGGDGAQTGSFNLTADECIAVDVSFAYAPDMPSKKCGKLGKGPMIGVAPALNYRMSQKLIETAKNNDIPFQYEIMGDSTGTDADEIAVSKCGNLAALVSIPQRNMHTGVEIVDVNDVENTAKLIAEYITGGGLDA